MRSGADEHDVRIPRVVPDEQKVWLDVAFPMPGVPAVQLMHPVPCLECFLRNESGEDSIECVDSPSTLLRPLPILLVLPGE